MNLLLDDNLVIIIIEKRIKDMAKLEVTDVYTKNAPWFFTLNVNVENQKALVLDQVNERLNVPSGTFSIMCHGRNSEASIDPATAIKHEIFQPEKIVDAFNSVKLKDVI